jgi:predicted transcriptional regulator
VFDFAEGKAAWVANGLPREGETNSVLYAGEAVDSDPPVCALTSTAAEIGDAIEAKGYPFCVVLGRSRTVLGRVSQDALADSDPAATAESLMEAGPSTVRFNKPADELAARLAREELETILVTTPGGCLVGVFRREEAVARLRQPGP